MIRFQHLCAQGRIRSQAKPKQDQNPVPVITTPIKN